jgi:hypothetical protein
MLLIVNDFFFNKRKTHFIAYKSSTLQDPPRLLPEAEVRNTHIRITGKLA